MKLSHKGALTIQYRISFNLMVIFLMFFLYLWLQPNRLIANNQSPGHLRVGAFLAVTGQASFIGAPALATLKLYVNLLNLEGGLLGRKIELVDYDVGIDPRTAQIAAKRLIFIDKVNAIIGGSTAGAAMAVIPIITKAKIPYIALASSESIVSPTHKWVFKSSQTNRMACESIMNDISKRGISNIGIIAGDDGFALTMLDKCVEVAEDRGIEVSVIEKYRSNTRRVRKPLERIKRKTSIQALLNIDFGSSPAYVTRGFRNTGFDIALYQTQGVATLDYIDLSGEAANGVRLPVPPILIAEKLSDSVPVKPILLDYLNLYRKRWEVRPSVHGAHAYDALMLYSLAVQRAKSIAPIPVRNFLEKIDGYVGTSGIVRLSPENHLGLSSKAYRMAEIQNGEWVPID